MAEVTCLYQSRTKEGGIMRLERWPEGYVLWYHGEIAWKSWEANRREAGFEAIGPGGTVVATRCDLLPADPKELQNDDNPIKDAALPPFIVGQLKE